MKRLVRNVRRLSAAILGGLVWLGGCSSSSTEGVTISVELDAPRIPVGADGTRSFDTDRGVRVVLTRGFLNTGSVEIFSCSPSSSWRLSPRFVREAHAHVVGSPTLLGVPAVESLLARDGTWTNVGVLHPPPATYCRVRQTVLAADEDAPSLPPDGAMVGKSLFVEGTYAASDGAPHAFQFSSTASFDATFTVAEVALSVEGKRTAHLVLSKIDDRWFDGVDFDGDPQDAATKILENLRSSLGARFE